MPEPNRLQVNPPPAPDEAAAIVAALSAYLAARPASSAPPAPPERRWALAGRLAWASRQSSTISRQQVVTGARWRGAR